MNNSLIALLGAHIKNILLTCLWSPIIILFVIALFGNELDDMLGRLLLAGWIIQVFVTVFAHGIFLIPSYFWQQSNYSSIELAYYTHLPILLVPTVIYLLLCFALFNPIIDGNNSVAIMLAGMFGFIAIYSISLYTLLQKIIKTHKHENENQ